MRKTLERIIAHFDLGKLLGFERAGGHAGMNFFAETDRGKYLIKVLPDGADAASADADSARQVLPYLQRLTEHRFRNVPYLRAPDGSHLFTDDACRAMAQDRLDADAPDALDARMLEQMGEELARLHLVPSVGLPQRMTWMHDAYLRDAADILRLHHADREGVLELAAAAEARDFDWASLPQSILHGDLFMDNTLFRDGTLITFIDWEDVCLGASVLDFGMTVVGCCFNDDDHRFERDLYDGLLAGYQRVRPFLRQEMDAIAPAVRRAGVSAAVWRFLKWNHYEPSERPDDYYKVYWAQGLDRWEAP